MEWIASLRGQRVGLDTAPLIYFIEEHPRYRGTMRLFFEAMDSGQFRVLTSVITLTEVLVQPLRRGDTILAERYRDGLLRARGMDMVPIPAGDCRAGGPTSRTVRAAHA